MWQGYLTKNPHSKLQPSFSNTAQYIPQWPLLLVPLPQSPSPSHQRDMHITLGWRNNYPRQGC